MAAFCGLDPRRYAAASLLVTAARSPIESSIVQPYSKEPPQAEVLCEATNGARRRFLVSQCEAAEWVARFDYHDKPNPKLNRRSYCGRYSTRRRRVGGLKVALDLGL